MMLVEGVNLDNNEVGKDMVRLSRELPSSALRGHIVQILGLLWFWLLSTRSNSGLRDELDTGNINAVGSDYLADC